ncbi:MAG: type IV secretion protein IcmB, partial [Alphaproteobacteria bacterium]|nr:type IV secretion protein IcmB [Alphaproteobacteria bacterium]
MPLFGTRVYGTSVFGTRVSLAAAADDLQRLSWTLRRKPLESFLAPQAAVPLEAAGGALVCHDGSLVSLLALDGSRSMMGTEEIERFVDVAALRLNTAFVHPGHALHVTFERAPDEAHTLAAGHARAASRQAGRLGLDLDDLLAERTRRLTSLIAAETLVLACWTRPSVLPRDRLERDRRGLRRKLRDWLPAAGEAQCSHLALEGLWARHEALLDALSAVLAETGIVGRRLTEDEALRLMRRMVNGTSSTAADWRPVTVANDAPARLTEPPEAGALPPPLAPQLLVREPERTGGGVRIGERFYGALDMSLGPRHSRPFAELMAGLAAAGLPCRFSLLIEGGGLHRLDAAVSRVASSFLAFSSSDSLLARNALRDLAAMGGDAHAIVRLRLGLLTWTGAEESEAMLAARLGRLQQVAEGWGEAVFTPLTGDPLESVAASVPGFCCGATAEPALAPLTEALRLFPVGRPAPLSPLSTGAGAAHLFRSADGKPLPLAADEGGDYGFELIYGLPGQGKSVLMNALGLAFCLQGGQARLPLAAVIDIGPSSSGLVSLVREALPPERRHEAGWFPLRMTSEHAINPCDTQLGCRSPLPAERAFLTNLLGLMVTPAGDAGVPDGMRELLGPTFSGAYAMRSDKVAGAEPNAYTEGRDEDVDAAIAEAGLLLPSEPLWWEVVDLLFGVGAIEAAARAQRYAVPTLTDLLAAVREPAVQGLVGDARYGSGGETATQAFIRIVTALSGDWPVMFAPTAFDVGGARLAAIDLAEVAPQGSAEADRQAAAFYLLARHALTRHWWIGEDALGAIPEPYRAWHAARLHDIRESPKRLCYDEFHRTAGAPAVRAQVERDVREARKLRVRLVLASQRLEDFGGGALAELANRYWILGAGGKAREEETLAELFSLSETLSYAVRYRLTGPGRDGAPALLIAAGQGGRFEQLLINTPGPVELWALTTSPPDAGGGG